METFLIQGQSRMDCEHQISQKWSSRPYQILREKEIRLGGILGLFTRPGVEIEYYIIPYKRNSHHAAGSHDMLHQAPVSYQTSIEEGKKEYYAAEQASIYKKNLEEEKLKIIAAAKKSAEQARPDNETVQKIFNSLSEIKEKIEKPKEESHPAFVRVRDVLKLNDFSDSYTETIFERIRKELSLNDLENVDLVLDNVLEWIGESISIYKEETSIRKPKVMALVGPTGVGKTTTIAKLAAIYGIDTEEKPAVDVRMITIDAFRIEAQKQLETIGDIMRIPVSRANSRESLKDAIDINSIDIDLFLIDTIGKSPKDAKMLGEMKDILSGCPRWTQYHLVVSAGTKYRDIEEIMRQFEQFNYKAVIISKLDETDCVGNIISALAEKKKQVSFITCGQSMPDDIRKASVMQFLEKLDGFKFNRQKLENRFPSGEAEQFRWK